MEFDMQHVRREINKRVYKIKEKGESLSFSHETRRKRRRRVIYLFSRRRNMASVDAHTQHMKCAKNVTRPVVIL